MNRKVKPWIIAVFLFPGLLMYGYFFLVPAVQSFYYSLTEWNGFKDEKVFIGLDNFIDLAHDKTFLQAVGNTAVYGAGRYFGFCHRIAVHLFNHPPWVQRAQVIF